MAVVIAQPAPGNSFDFDDFADITTAPCTAIDFDGPRYRLTFTGTLTFAQQVAIQQRIISASPAEEQMRMKAAAYLTDTTPTLAEAHAQVRRLTRIVLGVDSAVLPGSNPGQDRA